MKKITIRKPERVAMEIADYFNDFLVKHNTFVTNDPFHPKFALSGHYSQMIQDIYKIIQEYEEH